MSTFSEQVEIKQEKKEKDKVRKEKLAEYFFSLSNTIFGTLVVGIALLLIENDGIINWSVTSCALSFGLILFYALARVGNNILK